MANEQGIQLLKDIGDGKRHAMDQFYRLYEGRVYQFALSRLREPFEASEILNEVMVEVWKKAKTFEGRSAVSTWILGIANHKILDRHRVRGRREFTELDDQIPDDDNVSCEAAIAGAQEADRVKICMDRLSEAHREVVHLAFFEDLPYTEVAEIMGIPAGTVKTRMFHAKKSLKECLAEFLGLA